MGFSEPAERKVAFPDMLCPGMRTRDKGGCEIISCVSQEYQGQSQPVLIMLILQLRAGSKDDYDTGILQY